jgi:hypothetical protein
MPFAAVKSISDSLAPQFLRALGCALMLCVAALPVLGAGSRALTPEQLDKELARYRNVHSLEADFTQVKTLSGPRIELKSKGHLSLKRTGGASEVDWLIKDPAYLRLHVTETKLELFESATGPAKQIVEGQDLQAKILRPIYAWLSVNSALIAEQYEVFAAGPGKFRLEPKDKTSPVKAMELSLDSTHLVHQVSLTEASGDRLKITFSGTKATE